jgi:glyoxylase-like metal-dependent hydrolase (beta-lactamase superfamily II)
MTGGALIAELEVVGIRPADIDCVAVSHLHFDHDGWIASPEGEPVFPNAILYLGAADYDYFVTNPDPALPKFLRVAPALHEVLVNLMAAGRIVLLDDATQLPGGIVALAAPGHTPGHMVFAVGDKDERLMILGDAMYCPEQLTDADLTAMHDVNPKLARATRELIQREAEAHGTSAIGCHFPGLAAARVVGGVAVPV